MPTAEVVTSTTSPVRVVWQSPFYRRAFLALFISGIGVSATTPQLTLFLVNDLGASLPVAGLYYLVNLVAPIAGFALGSLSDRQSNRLALFRFCAIVGGLGWLAMAAATRIWMPFAIGAVALSIGGGAMGQLFAATRDELSRRPTAVNARVIATVRMAFSAGWILGPVLGSWYGAAFGLRSLLVANAVLVIGQVIPLGRMRVERFVGMGTTVRTVQETAQETAQETTRGPAREPRFRGRMPLLVFAGASVLVMTGDTIKFAYLPLYMENDLGVSDTVRGSVIAIQPLLEFAMMPLFARLADRFTPIRIVTIGALLGTAANIAFATSAGVGGLFLGQILMSGLWAAMAGLGVSVAQQLYPQGVGFASSVFMSSIALAGGIGGAIGGFGTAALGLPHVFFLPAGLSVIGAVGLFWASRRYRPDESVFSTTADPDPVEVGQTSR